MAEIPNARFKRSQFSFYGTYLTLFWLVFTCFVFRAWYVDQEHVSIGPGIGTAAFFLIFLYAFAQQQYFFVLTEDALLVKNHWLFWRKHRFSWKEITGARYLSSHASTSSKGISWEAGIHLSTAFKSYDFRAGALTNFDLESLVNEINKRLDHRFRVLIKPHRVEEMEAGNVAELRANDMKVIESASSYSYHSSGRYNNRVFRHFILFNLLATPLLSYFLILSLQISYSLVVAVIFVLFPPLFGGLVSINVIKSGMVRNARLAIWLGLCSGVCSLYFQYSFWNGEHKRLTFSQQIVYSLEPIHIVRDTGRNFADAKQKWHWLVPWGIEFAFMSGIMLLGMPTQAKKPFSEMQQKWYDELEMPTFPYIKDVAQFVNTLIDGSFIPMRHDNLSSKKHEHCICTLYYIETERCYLSVVNKKFREGESKKGNRKFDETTILTYFPISQQMGASFKALTAVAKP